MADSADARRLGGGSSSGFKRSMPARPAQNATPAKPAQQNAAAQPGKGANAAAAPKRSWMGPIAGLAAGLGLAALMSHLGMGAEFANFIMMALLAVVAFVAIRFLLNRFGPAQNRQGAHGNRLAGAAAGAGGTTPSSASNPFQQPLARTATPESSTSVGANGLISGPSFAQVDAGASAVLPAGFDATAFARVAKLIFLRMQAANDKADLEDLRKFASPEMFAVFKLDLQDRAHAAQVTDVVQLDAEVLDFVNEADQQIVSVRFYGLIREEENGPTQTFDETWHLSKPSGGAGEWVIAGIAQND